MYTLHCIIALGHTPYTHEQSKTLDKDLLLRDDSLVYDSFALKLAQAVLRYFYQLPATLPPHFPILRNLAKVLHSNLAVP